ncbi:hypothetical protein [Desulforhabdus sp. TSK]|uniref:hypothetical protein n=1 Tax=Desulforhabdus sp. TSK TaxID=2925014 RepID=UPI001FC84D27|nr:hypothetical protein [Desulforhabdus sp. TSK]GKT09387.1 hypothetical protein DSTSK_26920 [Desulforhabdus sp. TSK]
MEIGMLEVVLFSLPPNEKKNMFLLLLLLGCFLSVLYAESWPLAVFLAAVLYLFVEHYRHRPSTRDAGTRGQEATRAALRNMPRDSKLPDADIHDLAILRLELEHLLAVNAIDPAFYHRAVEGIDTLLVEILDASGVTPYSSDWSRGREAAWKLLCQNKLAPSERPPWPREAPIQVPVVEKESEWEGEEGLPIQAAGTPDSGVEPTGETGLAGSQLPISVQPAAGVEAPPPSAQSTTHLAGEPAAPPTEKGWPVQAAEEQGASEASFPAASTLENEEGAPSSTSQMDKEEMPGYAWKPTAVSALERALRTLSGWPALVVPFLAQNIGWFIGGFCFVAGSILLVSYTSGFVKTLTVAAVLLAYTLFILWAAYRLRLKRPELETSSSVLFSLGALLVPLNVAASVRVIVAGQTPLELLVGSLGALMVMGGLYFVTMLASGVMERSLQGRHPRVFLALAAMQMAVPVLARFPFWPLLAALHSLLMGLLAYGLVVFTQEWLRSIFVERRKVAYYAAGTLVYAAVISFLHLTWGYGSPTALPAGYYSPFLMAVCGLLFYVDAHLKQWIHKFTYLSRLSFAIYGLSALALFLSAYTPSARLVTLCMGCALYATVVWQFLTLTPLFFLLFCLSWLYGLVVLQHLPDSWYLLGSLPGLAGLFTASRWLLSSRSKAMGLIVYRVWLCMAVVLAAWSIAHGRPGWVAMGTALTMTFLTLAGLRFAPDGLFHGAGGTGSTQYLLNGPWFYSVTFMAGVAVCCAPQGTLWHPWTQCASGFLLLAALWACFGLHLYRTSPERISTKVEVLLNSALLNLLISSTLAALLVPPIFTMSPAPPILMALLAAILLGMSLELRDRWLFYAALALWGAAGTIFKLRYFPEPATGAVQLLLALTAWGLIWWMEREPEEVRALRREQAALLALHRPKLKLLWALPVSGIQTYEQMLRPPLQSATLLLGSVGIAFLGLRLISGPVGWGWTFSALLGMCVTTLAGGQFYFPWLLPLSMSLGLGAWLSALSHLSVSGVPILSFAGAVYALLAWRVGVFALTPPRTAWAVKNLHFHPHDVPSEKWLHHPALAVMGLSLGICLFHCRFLTPNTVLPLTLAAAMVFLWSAGHRYEQLLHSYALLGLFVLASLLGYAWAWTSYFPRYPALFESLLKDPGLGLLLALVALCMHGTAYWLECEAKRKDAAGVGLHEALYRMPLRITATLLAMCAAVQQIALIWLEPVMPTALLPILVLILSTAGLFMAGHALARPWLNLMGILLTVFTGLWIEGTLLHPGLPFTLLPGSSAVSDRWLTLSLFGLSLAILAERLHINPHGAKLYHQPLRLSSLLTCSWAMLSASILLAAAPLQQNVFLPLTFFTLTLCLFPLLSPLPRPAIIRGIAVPLLLTMITLSTLPFVGTRQWGSVTALPFGYMLWGAGNFALPRWNERWPHWAVAPDLWPWMGLAAVSFGVVSRCLDPSTLFTSLSWGGYGGAAAVYSYLMLRNSPWRGFAYFGSLSLAFTGPAFFAAAMAPLETRTLLGLFECILLCSASGVALNLLWANGLLRAVPLWRTHGQELSVRWGLRFHDLGTPLLMSVSGFLSFFLLQMILMKVESLSRLHHFFSLSQWSWTFFTGTLITLSFLHLWRLHQAPWQRHAILSSLLFTLMSSWLESPSHLVHLPLFLALWSAMLMFVHSAWENNSWGGEAAAPLRQALSVWIAPSLNAAIITLLLTPLNPPLQWLLTLSLLAALSAIHGLVRQNRLWLLVSMVMLLALLHCWPLLWVPLPQAALLAPWYALQAAFLALFLAVSGERLQHYLEKRALLSAQSALWNFASREIALLYSQAWPTLALLALVEWILHGIALLEVLAGKSRPQPLMGSVGDSAAALAAALLLLLLGLQRAWKSNQAIWVYRTTAFGGAVGLYIRLTVLGLSPPGIWDTAAIMASAYVLFVIHRITSCKPLLHVVLLLPALALITVPLQLESAQAAGALMSIGALYLLTCRETRRPVPLYLGILSFNAAVYLWIPGLVKSSQALQLYVAPAAVSVLLLLHLHRKELKRSVLNSARLAATSILYASASMDVFLRGDFMIFVVAVILSLIGIILGIAFRTRAFLYSGVVFLVFNILGQLILLFPEQRLPKAMFLLALGAAITGGMIWFNLQRERILRHIRIFRTDLESWT